MTKHINIDRPTPPEPSTDGGNAQDKQRATMKHESLTNVEGEIK